MGLAALAAAALFLVSWGLLHEGFYTRDQVVDTPVYQRYGDAMAHGQVPYRDFGLEYPPGALPAFVLPSLGHPADFGAFRRVFEGLMALCGVAAVAFAALALRALGAGPERLAGALAFVALAPLAAGSVILSRFDLWPAAITAGALALLLARRHRLGLAALGLGVAVKVYPGVLVPLALAHVWRTRGRREALACLGALVAALAACFVPFLVLSPAGVWASVVRQTSRPLQIESLASGFLLVTHDTAGSALSMVSGHGSQNLAGPGAGLAAALLPALQVAGLVALWVGFARGPASREGLVRASAAAVAISVAFGKVLSPQYLIWLIPLVPLVRGRRGLAASGLLALALGLTQAWFPFRYWALALSFDPLASWLVLARDLVLVALVAVLAWPTWSRSRARAPARS